VAIAAPGSEADPVAALEEGADDFVADPMRLRELAARTRAVARRINWVAMPASAPRDDAMVVGWWG
jgi:DNA-binding response OmpR family regulator